MSRSSNSALVLLAVHSSEGTECHECVPSVVVSPVCVTVGKKDVTFQNYNALMCNKACGLVTKYKNMGTCKADWGKPPPFAGVTCATCTVPDDIYKAVCGESAEGHVKVYQTLRHAACQGFCGPKITIVSNERCGLP